MTTPENQNSAAFGASEFSALLERMIAEVQKEWDIGGMDSSTIYGEFAMEVARRAARAEREACAMWYAEKGWLLDEDDVPDAMRNRDTL